MVTLLLTRGVRACRRARHSIGAAADLARVLAIGVQRRVDRDRGDAIATRELVDRTRCCILAFLNYLPYSKHLHVVDVAASTSLLEHERARAEVASCGRWTSRRSVEQFGASRRRAPVVEEPARRLLVHRVRPLHRRVPGEHHRQAAEPAQDRRQHAPAADGEGAARSSATAMEFAASRARARRRRRRRRARPSTR